SRRTARGRIHKNFLSVGPSRWKTSAMELSLGDVSPVLAGAAGSLVAGACTGLGALPIYAKRRWSPKSQVIMLSVAAGVMLGATIFSLMVPALEVVAERTGSQLIAALTAAA